MADKKGGEREPVNVVHLNAIHAETIKKERDNFKPHTQFSFNPYRPFHIVTGKPNSLYDTEDGAEDKDTRKIFEHSHLPPPQKYISPQTVNQEYGWINVPVLSDADRNDERLFFARKQCDVTKPKEAEWRLKEQTENLN